MIKYPLAKPLLGDSEKDNLTACIDEGWVSSGRFIGEFEGRMSKLCGRKFGCATSSGTTALHLALTACGIGEGSKVLVPTLTYIATVNTILQCGAEPIFIDSRREDWQMNDTRVSIRIAGGDIDAVVAVHLYGMPCNIEFLERICKDRGVVLIEDVAEALGGKVGGGPLGSFGDVSCFSFYGNKTITTGEGGMVLCGNRGIYQALKHLKNQATVKPGEYVHDRIGFNYRMSNLNAAVGCAQLGRLEDILKRKEEICDLYSSELKGRVEMCVSRIKDVHVGHWLYSFLVETKELRDGLVDHLCGKGIESRPFFTPAHTMKYMGAKHNNSHFPVAQDISGRGINLPTYVSMTNDDVLWISAKVLGFLARVRLKMDEL